ncbi:MAG: RNA polymerase sigma factor [Chloroherpetonaceae bacterium]|nr:RNA polymerase sigma factor [Chloroherpetonaceae bacterium]MCS7210070.1 RNA polymerase sigma factor [Chloroherpetonaceae bacterium]MDW8020609.1 RNA polymerase sigma factor [Chloroherpetonaceae bacterium]MDW8464985.1 RNA polymerase sigma factor [Chloroherpetonaceae bacterium]
MAKHELSISEMDLIQAAQAGNLRAFERLVERYDERVLALVWRYTASEEDAKDLYQEIFLRVYRGLPQFEGRSEFSTWLYQIVTNVCLSYRTQQQRLSQEQDVLKSEDALNGYAVSPSPMLALQVEEALMSLSPHQKMAFLLKHYEGYSIKEIAKMMNCAEGTVKKHLYEAVTRLQRVLRDLSV